MKITYEEAKKETEYMDVQDKLIQISKLEQRLFKTIAMGQSSDDDSQRNYLNRQIDSLQTEYSLIHI